MKTKTYVKKFIVFNNIQHGFWLLLAYLHPKDHMNMSKWVGLFYKTNEQLNVSCFTRKPSSLKLVLHPQHMECKTTTIDSFQKRWQIGQNTKLEMFLNQRRSKRIKVQNDVPFGYAIKNIFMLNKSEFIIP